MTETPNETTMIKINRNDKKNDKDVIYGVYIKSLLTKRVILSITEIGKNIKQNLEQKISTSIEGKCIEEGFIRPSSTKIISYSSGVVHTENIVFEVIFECMLCHPVEGMHIECTSKTITKAGIHAEVLDINDVVPVTVFIARDHHYTDKYFNTIKENMKIVIVVIGIRYELNDPYICAIGKLIEKDRNVQKPRIVVGGEHADINEL